MLLEEEKHVMRMTEEEFAEFMKRRGLAEPEPKKSKYRNRRVRVDGILFDSQKEADYYQELKLQLKAGNIKGFCRQPEFILQEGFGDIRPITYKPDFIVFHNDGSYEIVDIKGFETQEFKRTRKLFKAKFPRLELKVVK